MTKSTPVKVLKTIRIHFTKKTGRSHIIQKLSNGKVHIITYVFNPMSCRPDKIELLMWETSLLMIAAAYEEALFDEDSVTFPKETFKLG